jgi:hypothetical protein
MQILANVRIEVLSRIMSLRFELNDWAFGIKKSRSGASFVASLGPIHFGYSNINKMMSFLSDMVAEIEEEYDRTRENGETNQVAETESGERVLH